MPSLCSLTQKRSLVAVQGCSEKYQCQKQQRPPVSSVDPHRALILTRAEQALPSFNPRSVQEAWV